MAKNADYYFTAVSPWSFLGHERFAALAAKHGAAVNVKPVDYGRIFPASGGMPLKQRAPQRQAYRLIELWRWREHLGVKMNLEPKHFPVPADGAACLIIATDLAHGTTAAMDMALALYRACWVEERNVADAETLRAIAREQGRDPDRLLAEAPGKAARAKFDAYTQEAVDRGVFGAPTYMIDGEPFWGQDRLEFVAKALAA
ncbi:MAG: 2-hydroxychromene-2-carboxylate isomerase [Burkholderiales bacterium]|nr:2-hydroxychromene-2-carboxylate isomerase [Burkholderiales bacterium]